MVQYRKDILTCGEIFHIYTRSIAKFVVFNNDFEYQRIVKLLNFYAFDYMNYKFSEFIELSQIAQDAIMNKATKGNNKLVEIVAYCIMPTHIHLILKQIPDNGISKFMSKVLNSYTRFFNQSHNRIGPLWSGRFKNVLVDNDEQLLHLTRYLHLNPSSTGIVKKPEEWSYSSYQEYVDDDTDLNTCTFKGIINMGPKEYRKFTNNQKEFQRSLATIKSQIIENYTG